WSRPLVAALFFLQPVVRGLARYRGRLTLQPTPQSARQRLAAYQRHGPGELDEVQYAGPDTLDRIGFLSAVQERLDQQGWTSKSDTGWSDHDIEVYGSRWSWLRLTNVTESYGVGGRVFRCRLQAGWSLPAKVLFWSAC